MSDYLGNANNQKWEWKVGDGKAIIEVDHGNHKHELDVSTVTLEEISTKTNEVLGAAHAASHDKAHNNKK